MASARHPTTSIDTGLIDGLLHLFRGNVTCVGLDDTGSGKPGPLRITGDRPTWRRLVTEHLTGQSGIGVYPYNHRAQAVAWGCVDLDEGEQESWDMAIRVRSVLRAYGAESWIERSRSKGYHLWLFGSDWTSPPVMRRALVGACQAASAVDREVNPKSETLLPDQLGNFVRLPYKGLLRGDGAPIVRQVIVDLNGVPLPPELFVPEAVDSAVDPGLLAEIARDLYVEPPPAPRAYEGAEALGEVYVDKAVTSAIQRVTSEPSGNRNNTLNREAFSLLRLIHNDREARHVLNTLHRAAVANGLSDREVRQTLNSAWRASHKRQEAPHE